MAQSPDPEIDGKKQALAEPSAGVSPVSETWLWGMSVGGSFWRV